MAKPPTQPNPGGHFNPSGRWIPDNPPPVAANPANANTSNGNAPTPIPLADQFRSGFSNLPYGGTQNFQNLVSNFTSDPSKFLVNEGNVKEWQSTIKSYGDTFANMFKNYVGRDPNAEEYNQFFGSVVLPNWKSAIDPNNLRQTTTGLIDQFYQRTAADEAQKRAETQANKAVETGSAFDAWQQAQKQNLSDTEKSLQDYQSRLFEKIRPQLLTSLQSQGLLNSGALNQAFTGVAGDLASEGQNFIANARNAVNSDIANRKYEIAASPSNYALQREFSAVPNLTAAGQSALQNVWQNYMQDRAFQNQSSMLDKQYALNSAYQPSLLSQYGGLILGGAAGAFGKRLGGGWGR